jgi:hypothetical protein|tara:strand:+ start:372 stop:602 length:231 start_codon:yes stop_codon:yes gene_type:complete
MRVRQKQVKMKVTKIVKAVVELDEDEIQLLVAAVCNASPFNVHAFRKKHFGYDGEIADMDFHVLIGELKDLAELEL